MIITIAPDKKALGALAAQAIAGHLGHALQARGEANLLLSTGMSQAETMEALVRQELDWGRVRMFHLDEYIALPPGHPASFRKYLQERFVSRLSLKEAFFINGDRPQEALRDQARLILEHPIDVGVIGIGENAHIAFNDPPADFAAQEAFKVVTLNEACKRQQVNEGWFPSIDRVPPTAISMTVQQILRCRAIVSPVPDLRKAEAVRAALEAATPDPMVPASILKGHPAWHLFLDRDSFSACAPALRL